MSVFVPGLHVCLAVCSRCCCAGVSKREHPLPSLFEILVLAGSYSRQLRAAWHAARFRPPLECPRPSATPSPQACCPGFPGSPRRAERRRATPERPRSIHGAASLAPSGAARGHCAPALFRKQGWLVSTKGWSQGRVFWKSSVHFDSAFFCGHPRHSSGCCRPNRPLRFRSTRIQIVAEKETLTRQRPSTANTATLHRAPRKRNGGEPRCV